MPGAGLLALSFPSNYLLQVRLWWGPQSLALRLPHHQKLHMFVYRLMAQAT